MYIYVYIYIYNYEYPFISQYNIANIETYSTHQHPLWNNGESPIFFLPPRRGATDWPRFQGRAFCENHRFPAVEGARMENVWKRIISRLTSSVSLGPDPLTFLVNGGLMNFVTETRSSFRAMCTACLRTSLKGEYCKFHWMLGGLLKWGYP